jgi:hypothetical protein
MNGKLCKAFILASALATAGCEKHPAQSAFEPDPIVHPASGRIVFNRMCADENPYSVQAYARMASKDGRAQAVAAFWAGYRATGGRTAYIALRLHRLKLNAGAGWENADYSLRLIGRAGQRIVEGPKARRDVMASRSWFSAPVSGPHDGSTQCRCRRRSGQVWRA